MTPARMGQQVRQLEDATTCATNVSYRQIRFEGVELGVLEIPEADPFGAPVL